MVTVENLTFADRTEALFASWPPAAGPVAPDALDAAIAGAPRTARACS